MKKYFILSLISVVFSLVSCNSLFDSVLKKDTKILNSSSHTVTFTLENYNADSYTLAPGESITENLYSDPRLIFVDNPRVSVSYDDSLVTIHDSIKYSYTFTNLLNKKVIISEEGNYLGDTYGYTLTLNGQQPRTEYVYSPNPKFMCFLEDTSEDVSKFVIITKN
ncbi:hypothetical protein [Treponema sp.]|uniref:hypothetical protein n=1 Tax=Treponema sp. TaxID=166 RepID=UPI003FD702C4